MDFKNHTPLISASVAAEHFGITNDYISRLCRQKKVEGVLVGRVWQVRETSLARYLNEQRANQKNRHTILSQQLRNEYPRNVHAKEHPFAAAPRYFPSYAAVLVGVVALCSWAGVAYGAWDALSAPRAFAVQTVTKPLAPHIEPMHLPTTREEAHAAIARLFAPVPIAEPRLVPQAQHAPDFYTAVALVNKNMQAANDALFGAYAQAVHGALEMPGILQADLATFAGAYISGVQSYVALVHATPGAYVATVRAFVSSTYALGEESNAAVESELNLAAVGRAVGGATVWDAWTGFLAQQLYPVAPHYAYATATPAPQPLQRQTHTQVATGTTPLAAPSLQKPVSFYQLPKPATAPAVARAASGSLAAYVTQDVLATKLNELQNKLTSLLYQNISAPGSLPASGGYTNNIALSQKIDNLSNVTINNLTITGSISGITAGNIPALSALSGLLAIGQGGTGTSTAPGINKLLLSDASGNWEYVATTSLGISGGSASLAGLTDVSLASSVFGNLLEYNGSNWINVATSSLGISGSASPFAWAPTTNFGAAANSTSTLIGFTQGIYSLASSTIGDGTQTGGLTISGGSTTTLNAYFASNVGIGTTSPYAKLSITGIGITSATTAFAISNSAGTSTFAFADNGTASFFGNSGNTDAWQTAANALPAARTSQSSVIANGYVYVMGGYDGISTVQSTVYYAKLNADGSVGAFATSTNALPAARSYQSSIVANGYVYVMGGANSSFAAQSTVYYAKLNADGSVGAWQTAANALPAARYAHSSVVANGYVYVMGGVNAGAQSTVYYAKLNADGSVGAWKTAANALPAARSYQSSIVANGYVYVMGGINVSVQSTVYYAKLNADGSVGAWQTAANALPAARYAHSSVIANGYVYVIGGYAATVYYAKLNADGSVGTFATSTNALPAVLNNQSSVVANGYVYVMGGNNAGVYSTVYYASLSRTLLGTNLDLIGMSSSTLADVGGDASQGSVGGSIFAGNIFSNGTLNVTGNTNLSGGLGVSGAFTLNATTSQAQNYSIFSLNNATGTAPIFTALYNGNVGIGTTNPSNKLDVTGFINTDQYSGYKIGGSLLGYASSTNQVTIFGLGAGGTATTSSNLNETTAIGYKALNALNTTSFGYGVGNSAVGSLALTANTTGSSNNAFGANALAANTTGSQNIAIGYQALNRVIGSTNDVAIGYQAGGQWGGGGVSNIGSTYIGASTGISLDQGSDYNTFVGYKAGFNVSTGADNLLLGSFTSYSNTITTGSNNIGIGFNSFFTSPTANNQLNIGNLIYGSLPATTTGFALPTTGSLGIGTSTPWAKFSIATNNGDTNTVLFAIGSSTQTATSTLFIVNNIGNVGVGTTSPFAKLSIVGNGTTSATTAFAIANSAASSTFTLQDNGTASFFGNSGNTDAWQTAGNALPATRTYQSSVIANGYVYVMGGMNSSSVTQSTVYYASLSRTLLGTNLDLIGMSSSTLADVGGDSSAGSVGGSIFAGNIFSNGTLNVTGNTNLSGGLGVSGAFTLNATTSQEQTNSIFSLNNATGTAPIFTALYNGNVGIGTSTPLSTLTVVGSGCFGATSGVTLLCGTTAGNIYYNTANTGGGTYDVAEEYATADAGATPGTIVALAPSGMGTSTIVVATSSASIFGVISTNPGLVLGGADASLKDVQQRPVALSGRVPVKVNMEGGPIAVGDPITLSSVAGVGTKATTTSYIVGIALQSYTSPTASSSIVVFVQPGMSFVGTQLQALAELASWGATSTPAVANGSFMDNFFRNMFVKVSTWLADASNGITKLFAGEVHTQKLCVSDSSGETCITKAQLDTLLAGAGAAPAASASSSSSSSASASGTTTPDVATTTPTASDATTTPPAADTTPTDTASTSPATPAAQ